jgi:hypothetical protein
MGQRLNKFIFYLSSVGVMMILLIYAIQVGIRADQPQHIQGVVTDVSYLPYNGLDGSSLTVVKFDDGREKTFTGIDNKLLFQKGKVNVITYSSDGILSVGIK